MAARRFGEQRLARTLAGVPRAPDAIIRIDRALRAFPARPAGRRHRGARPRASSRGHRTSVQAGLRRAASWHTHVRKQTTHGGETMADAGPPIVLTALGLILLLAVDASLGRDLDPDDRDDPGAGRRRLAAD